MKIETMKIEKRFMIVVVLMFVVLTFTILFSNSINLIEVKFEPELIRYSGSLYNHNIQAAHIPSVSDLTNEDSLILKNKKTYWGTTLGEFTGNSMQPTIFEGNTLIVMGLFLYDSVEPGQIIRYRESGCFDINANYDADEVFIVHRVVATYVNNTVVMRGDNNVEEEVIKRCQISHIVIGILYT